MLKIRSTLLSLVALLAVALPVSAQVDDKDQVTIPKKELDARIRFVLYEFTRSGVVLYDRGDVDGCITIFRSGLVTAHSLLDHRPDVKTEIEKGVQEAEKLKDKVDHAFALRKIMDETRRVLRDGAAPAVKSLWERAGGETVFKAVVHDFLDGVVKDPKVNFTRNPEMKFDAKRQAEMEKLLVELLSEATGGPLKYTGKDLKEVHKGMKITNAEFDAMLGHLLDALEKHKVPEKEGNALLKIANDAREAIVDGKFSVKPPEKDPLWPKLGGEKVVKAIIKDVLTSAGEDPKVNLSRDGKFELDEKALGHLETQLVELVSHMTGGPLKYTGKDLKAAHEHMKITEAEFDALAKHISAALKKNKVPDAAAAEFMKIIDITKKDIVEKK